jgi:hypothetical protein
MGGQVGAPRPAPAAAGRARARVQAPAAGRLSLAPRAPASAAAACGSPPPTPQIQGAQCALAAQPQLCLPGPVCWALRREPPWFAGRAHTARAAPPCSAGSLQYSYACRCGDRYMLQPADLQAGGATGCVIVPCRWVAAAGAGAGRGCTARLLCHSEDVRTLRMSGGGRAPRRLAFCSSKDRKASLNAAAA